MGNVTRRKFLEGSLAATGAAAVSMPLTGALSGQADQVEPVFPDLEPRDEPVRVGVIGVRGRGRGHVGAYKGSKKAEVVAICDADEAVIGGAMKAVPNAKYFKDLRNMLEDPNIDAVSIATPNHWHSLASIWALQAGKHVYVEKPLSHNIFEGRKLVEAAVENKRLVQHGTQSRSAKATRDAIAWMQAGHLGKVLIARALCYKRRGSIGKVKGPQKIPANCDYDLWTGPAEMRPLRRKKMHYDWHWDFNTGNGDLGNQGVHQMDIARWGLGAEGHPDRVMSCGGRLGYDDDGDTPNTLVTCMDYGEQKLIFEVRGLPTKAYPSQERYKGAKIGVVFHCENGYLVIGSYAKSFAFDHDGNQVKEFRGGGDHFENFLDAVQSGKASKLHAGAMEGHLSAAACHIGNIPYRIGHRQKLSASDTPFGDNNAANESFARFRQHLVENKVLLTEEYDVGPLLQFDGKTERFVGDHSFEANMFVSRNYRGKFVVAYRIPLDTEA